MTYDCNRLRDAAARLLAAYEAEESEYGFPFNLELREAHRDLAAALAAHSDPPGKERS